MNRRDALVTLTSTILVSGLKNGNASDSDSDREHTAWVGQVLIRMQTVKVHMRRADLYGPFTTEGGVFTPSQRTYISRDCPYFKVDVKFRVAGPSEQNPDGTVIEDPRDEIVAISRPYLALAIDD